MIDISKRDKKILSLGAIFLLIFIIAEFFYFPPIEKKENLQQLLAQKTEQVQEMKKLQKQFLSLSRHNKNNKNLIKKRDKNFSLFSFIDQKVQECGIKKNVAFMKPFSSKIEKSIYLKATVKIKLNNLYLKELVDFLYKIESSKNLVVISALSLSRTGKKEFRLDAIIETQTLIIKGSV